MKLRVILILLGLLLLCSCRKEESKVHNVSPGLPMPKGHPVDIHKIPIGSKIIFGDSLIYNWSSNPPANWTAVGYGGYDTTMLAPKLDEIIKRRPSSVILFMGINNVVRKTRAKFIPDYTAAIDKLQTIPSIKIYIMSILPINCPTYLPEISSMNDDLKELCSRYHIEYLDGHNLFIDHNKFKNIYFVDGIHLNALGYNLLNDFIGRKFPANRLLGRRL